MKTYEPMIAQKGDKAILERPNLVGYLFEPYFEGIRVLIYKDRKDIAIFNRKKQDLISIYPEMLELPAFINAKTCILDGVLIVINQNQMPDLSLLQKRELTSPLKINLIAKKFPATLFVFDIIELNENSLQEEPLKKRKLILKDIIKNSSHIMAVPYTLHGKDLWKQVKQQNLRGMIAKEMNSRYMPGKINWSWLRIDNTNQTDAIATGLIKNNEKISGIILSEYVKKTDSFRYIGEAEIKANKTLSDYIKNNYKKISISSPCISRDEQEVIAKKSNNSSITWLKPSLIIKTRFKEKQDNILIEPSIVKITLDKDIKDCIIEN